MEWSAEELEQTAKVARRLMGPVTVPAGRFMSVRAAEDLSYGIPVIVDAAGKARKWNGTGIPDGLAFAISKGNYGWIQIT